MSYELPHLFTSQEARNERETKNIIADFFDVILLFSHSPNSKTSKTSNK